MTRTRELPPAPAARLAPQQAVARRAGLRSLVTGQGSSKLLAQAALVWLLLALVLVPTLGRLHQVMHAPAAHAHAPPEAALSFAGGSSAGAGTPAAHAHSHGDTPDHPSAAHAHSLLDALLAHHAPVDCLLLDQLALGDALHSAPAALAAPVPAQAPLVHPAATAAARHVTLFQARGPPAMA